MAAQDVTIPLAFLAGLASFLSPCVLALVPAYIGYLSGRSVTAEGVVIENRWETFGHGLAFVSGFSLVFIGLGAAASLIGALLYDLRVWLTRLPKLRRLPRTFIVFTLVTCTLNAIWTASRIWLRG